MYQGTFQAILHQIISNFLTQHAVCNGVSKAWKLKYVNEEAVAWLEFLISPDQFFPPFVLEMHTERGAESLIELGSQGNALTVQTTLSSAIFVQTKYCLCFGKPSFSFSLWDPIIPFYLKGFLEVEEATPNIGFSIPFLTSFFYLY